MPFSLTSEQKQAGLWLTLGLLLMAFLILLGWAIVSVAVHRMRSNYLNSSFHTQQ